jgi:hypothetical protein
MAKRKDSSDSTQLTLNLTSGARASVVKGTGAASGNVGRQDNVTVFIDSATLAVRREAVERIARSGIFAVPNGHQRLVKG